MKQQIKKLCKQLSRFNFDEIASILELPDEEIQNILQELIAEKVISKISETEFCLCTGYCFRSTNGNIASKKLTKTTQTRVVL